MIGLGYKPSPSDKIGRGDPSHLFSAAALPPKATVRQNVIEVLDQVRTSACVAHAVTQQIRTVMVGQGIVLPELPSRLFVYYGARANYGDQNFDGGTYIHSAYECAESNGFPPESVWPFSTDDVKVNTQPDWAAVRAASDQRWLSGHYRIVSSGLARVYDVKAALAAGHPVTWGTLIDTAFRTLTPGKVWPGATKDLLGGHATLIVGYEGDVFEVCNSWGKFWCDAGFCLVSKEAIASNDARDFWVATVAPKFSELT